MDLKLTNGDMATYNATTWRLGEWREANGEGALCTEGWLHYYHDASPELAVVLNPIHANFSTPRLFCVETAGRQKHDALKSGAQKLRLVEELDVPTVSTAVRIRFAIYAARAIPNHPPTPAWETWADKWLSGEDRASDVAKAAGAAGAAAWTATMAWAAEAAAGAARAARAAAEAAAWAAGAAEAAAWAAAGAAEAARAAAEIDFRQLLAQAIQDEQEIS